eukprot:361902-Chlamydomonas_euryale.AAC.10
MGEVEVGNSKYRRGRSNTGYELWQSNEGSPVCIAGATCRNSAWPCGPFSHLEETSSYQQVDIATCALHCMCMYCKVAVCRMAALSASQGGWVLSSPHYQCGQKDELVCACVRCVKQREVQLHPGRRHKKTSALSGPSLSRTILAQPAKKRAPYAVTLRQNV